MLRVDSGWKGERGTKWMTLSQSFVTWRKAVHIEKRFTIRQFDLDQWRWQGSRTFSRLTYSLNREQSLITQQGGGWCSKYFDRFTFLILEEGIAVEDLWAYKGWGDRGLEKTSGIEASYDLHCSPSVIRRWHRTAVYLLAIKCYCTIRYNKTKYYILNTRMIKSRRWVGHVACAGRGEVRTAFWWGTLKEQEQ